MSQDLALGRVRRNWSRDPSAPGPRTASASGSVLLPASQQRAIFNKLDDVRYDVRRAGRNVGAAVLALSAALGAVAVASVYRTSRGK